MRILQKKGDRDVIVRLNLREVLRVDARIAHTNATRVGAAAKHVEGTSSRSECLPYPGRRRRARYGGREVCPALVGGAVGVQVPEQLCGAAAGRDVRNYARANLLACVVMRACKNERRLRYR